MKFQRSLLAASAASLALLCGTAQAQNQQNIPDPSFAADEAAYCSATFQWILQYMSPGEEDTGEEVQRFQMQNNLAAMMWNYELNLAMYGEEEDAIQSQFSDAATELTAQFPEEGTENFENNVVQAVMQDAAECGQKLQAEYPDGNHPVIVQLERQFAAQQQQQQQQQQQAPGVGPIGD